MARHNRQGEGVDQAGYHYQVSYPPDWLYQVRVGRTLPSGRRSTQTLFRNPQAQRQGDPGDQLRVHIRCESQGVDLSLMIRSDPERCQRVVADVHVPGAPGRAADVLNFVIEGGLE
jgi:hypothetical protein